MKNSEPAVDLNQEVRPPDRASAGRFRGVQSSPSAILKLFAEMLLPSEAYESFFASRTTSSSLEPREAAGGEPTGTGTGACKHHPPALPLSADRRVPGRRLCRSICAPSPSSPLRQTFDNIARRIGATNPRRATRKAPGHAADGELPTIRPTWDPEHDIYDASRTAIKMADWYAFRIRPVLLRCHTMARAKQ